MLNLLFRPASSPVHRYFRWCFCQKSSGAPVVSWMDFHAMQLSWTKGKPSEYKSSELVLQLTCKVTCFPVLSSISIKASIVNFDDLPRITSETLGRVI